MKILKVKNLKGLIIVLLAVLVLTGCLPKKEKSFDSEGKPIGEGVSAQKEEEGESYSGNLEKMMGLGIPLKCTWKMDENYYGTSWVKGKKSYGEIVQEGKTAKVINKDDCMWAWEEGNPQGTKICMQVSQEEMKQAVEQGRDMTKQQQGYQSPDMDFKCMPAIFGDDKFNPPGDVNFMDMGEMMKGFNQ